MTIPPSRMTILRATAREYTEVDLGPMTSMYRAGVLRNFGAIDAIGSFLWTTVQMQLGFSLSKVDARCAYQYKGNWLVAQ
jgi:hypothetical protein